MEFLGRGVFIFWNGSLVGRVADSKMAALSLGNNSVNEYVVLVTSFEVYLFSPKTLTRQPLTRFQTARPGCWIFNFWIGKPLAFDDICISKYLGEKERFRYRLCIRI